jgi:ubiquinone/menaquinone biosynthesis C-methylase UbiE
VSDASDHVLRNRQTWDGWAAEFEEAGHRAWALVDPTWGLWDFPESEAHLFPDDLEGLDCIELGCGTGYISAWLARLGAQPVGLDNSWVQLQTAHRFQREFGVMFSLVHGDAERLPFPDASFDFAISEYGASIWCDPYRWIPEAARVLRPGGQLSFLVNGTILMLCVEIDDSLPPSTAMLRDYFGMHRFEWLPELSVEFHLGYGDTIRLLRDNGFEVEDLIEIQAPEGATTRFEYVTSEWAHRWPSEEVWKVRKTG